MLILIYIMMGLVSSFCYCVIVDYPTYGEVIFVGLFFPLIWIITVVLLLAKLLCLLFEVLGNIVHEIASWFLDWSID